MTDGQPAVVERDLRQMLRTVVWSEQRRYAERAPALEKELAQLVAEQQRCRQEGKRVLQTIEQRMAELRDELAAVQREAVSTAAIQRAVARFDPAWTCCSFPSASASCTCSSSPWSMTVPRANSS